jgi:hypothetical protein
LLGQNSFSLFNPPCTSVIKIKSHDMLFQIWNELNDERYGQKRQ